MATFMAKQSNISSDLLFFPRYPFLLQSVPLHSVLFSSRLCLSFSEDPVLDELKDFGGLWNSSVWISMMSWIWSGLSWKRKTMRAKFTHSSWFITADNCGPVTDKMFISFTPPPQSYFAIFFILILIGRKWPHAACIREQKLCSTSPAETCLPKSFRIP